MNRSEISRQNSLRGRKKEKLDAKRGLGKQQVNSGAFWTARGDLKSEHVLIDCKSTIHSQYNLKKSTWDKIRQQALKINKFPMISLILDDNPKRYDQPVYEAVVMESRDLFELCQDREKMILIRCVDLCSTQNTYATLSLKSIKFLNRQDRGTKELPIVPTCDYIMYDRKTGERTYLVMLLLNDVLPIINNL